MKLPAYFKPIMWSWDFEEIDPQAMKNTIVIQTLNYGDLKHWRWIKDAYGANFIHQVLQKNKGTNMDQKNVELVQLVFKFS